MNYPDGELPENWQGKTKDDSTRGSIRRLWLAVALLVLLLGIGVSVGILRPDLLGALFPNVGQTQTAEALAVNQTQQALQATAQANSQLGTQAALNLQGTQAALDATQAAFNQAGTQAALDAIAARTATVQAIQQQATTNALDLQGTQAALNLAGTQAGLDVQSTLAALQGTNPTQAIVDPLLATPTPTSGTTSMIDDDFSEGISPGVWAFSMDHWLTTANGGLIANHPGSNLVTQRTTFSTYTLDVWFTPPTGTVVIYLLHNPPEGTPWMVRLDYDNAILNETKLLSAQEMLSLTSTRVISTTYHVRLQVSPAQLTVNVNDQLMIDTPFSGTMPGAVGVVMPTGTVLSRIVISEQ